MYIETHIKSCFEFKRDWIRFSNCANSASRFFIIEIVQFYKIWQRCIVLQSLIFSQVFFCFKNDTNVVFTHTAVIHKTDQTRNILRLGYETDQLLQFQSVTLLESYMLN